MEDLKFDRLLNLIKSVKNKYDFYNIIKKTFVFMSRKEFQEEKLIELKTCLLKILEEFSERKGNFDRLIIPFIFVCLMKIFFKKNKKQNGAIKRRNSLIDPPKMPFHEIQDRSVSLIVKSLEIAALFIRTDINEDISLSALNYIYRYIEEPIKIQLDNNVFAVK
jgi:hypothetical protein